MGTCCNKARNALFVQAARIDWFNGIGIIRFSHLIWFDETHFKINSNIDLTAFDAYSPVFIERGIGEKLGGGKMILLSLKYFTQ